MEVQQVPDTPIESLQIARYTRQLLSLPRDVNQRVLSIKNGPAGYEGNIEYAIIFPLLALASGEQRSIVFQCGVRDEEYGEERMAVVGFG